jgi:gliding motility-associated-like protein
MKRSLLLYIKENQLIKAWSTCMQQISKVLLSLLLAVLPNLIKAQDPCDSMTLSYFKTNPACYGSANGTINLTMSGGSSPYSFNWNTGATTEDLNGLSAAVYSVLVTDQNGCMDSAVISLSQPQPLSNVPTFQDVLCHGANTGFIVSHVSGGTSPYNYYWSNGSQSANAVFLTAGVYTVTVVDYHGCAVKDTVKISEPDALTLDLNSPELIPGYNISYYMGNDGSVDLTVSGGVAPYWYAWSNGASTEDISNLSANAYTVLVKDANGCSASGTIGLDQPSTVAMPTAFSPNNDGHNDNFIVHGADDSSDNLLTIFNRWGNIVYQQQNYTDQWKGHNNKGEELPDGTYFAIMEIKSKEMVLKGYVEMKRR